MAHNSTGSGRKGSRRLMLILVMSAVVSPARAQSPLNYSIATPRPIDPAEGTTTPSAQATQQQNPFLGSVPSKNTGTKLEISLKDAMNRGLRVALLSFMDCFRVIAWLTLAAIPLLLMIRGFKPVGKAPATH
jgi:hypothetical protein